ncbi:MAG: hypothetical protein QOC87_980 [Actinomycetota bacterium]|jgi:hypothetical protein|nr:hypothetical protein [Actinomycetota bacterium]
MKRTLVVFLALGLMAGALAVPAQAKKAKPVATTLYMHGTQPAGEAELPDTWLSSTWMTMDATKPTDAAPKSMFVTNYLAGPNTTCSGNGLVPTWRGTMAGTVKGTLTITLNTVGSPAAKLQADVFPDGNGGCESSLGSTGYTPPVATAVQDVPPGPGTTTFTFKNVNFKAAASLVIMLSIPGAPANPYQVRVLYDGAGFESSVKFSCIPASGSSCAS